MKKIGIWLDKEKAHIVTLNNGKEYVKTVLSELDFFNAVGGSGTRQKGGPQDVVQDSKYLEREIHQFNIFFTAIAEEVMTADSLMLFGPAQSNEKLKKELEKTYPKLAAKIKKVIKADSMTDNQIKAFVIDFYSNN